MFAFATPQAPGEAQEHSNQQQIDTLFSFLIGQVSQADLIKDITAELALIDRAKAKDREQKYIRVYFALESFLLRHMPPVVVSSHETKETLRQAVGRQIGIQGLSPAFRLIFLPGADQAAQLFVLGLGPIHRFVVEHLGLSRLQLVVSTVTGGTVIEGISVTEEGIELPPLGAEVSVTDITAAFQKLYKSIFEDVSEALGEKSVTQAYKRVYEVVQTTYDYPLVSLFLEALPKELFEAERLALLSRQDLESQVAARTQESERQKLLLEQQIALVQKQGEKAEETKLAMINLLEDARELEEKIKDERDRANAIVSTMGEGLFVVDMDYRVTLINPMAAKLLGIKPEDGVGKNLMEITKVYKGETELSREQRPLWETIQNGQSKTFGLEDDYYLESRGIRIPIAISTVPLVRDGKTVGGLVTFHDISRDKQIKETIEKTVEERTRELSEKNVALETARKQISDGWVQLQQEKARLTASIESLPIGYLMIDKNGEIVMLNRIVTKILDIVPTVRNVAELEAHLKAKLDLGPKATESMAKRQSMVVANVEYATKFLRLLFAPIIADVTGSDVLGVVVLVDDITEAKTVERSRDEFFSIASHELRTPLTAIRGNTSMMLEFYKEKLADPELAGMVTDIHESSIRLIGIVNDFLNVSRLEMGRMEFKKEAIDLTAIAQGVKEELAQNATEKGLTIVFDMPKEDFPSALADKDRVKEVLINLVGNAIKYSEKGTITIGFQKEVGAVDVLITDTGRGIASSQQGLLFHKFQQTGESLHTRDTTKGTGLGLYISKLLTEGMGGKIWLVSSEEGKGSTFAFRLPAAPAQMGQAGAAQTLPPEERSKEETAALGSVLPRLMA